MTDSPDVPITWSALLRADRELLDEGLALVAEAKQDMESVRWPRIRASVFGGPAYTLAHAAVVLGPASDEEAIKTLIPLLRHALSDLTDGVRGADCVPAMSVHSFINTAQCCNAQVPQVALEFERGLPQLLALMTPELSELEQHTMAFASIAAGSPELVPQFVGGGKLPAHVAPGKVFDFNVTGFARYLAGAVQSAMPIDAIRPAWECFVERFPHKRAAGTLDWADLLYVARIVVTQFDGQSVGTVAAWLHEDLASR